MNLYDRRTQGLAIVLASLAGYVDAVGFIELGGFFVSFMSGNTTRMGVAGARGDIEALYAAGLIAIFVSGVTFGSLVGRRAGDWRRRTIFFLIALTLAGAASLYGWGFGAAGAVAMAFAMGMENTVLEENGETRVGLTYMTGALVKFGQRLAVAWTGGPRFGWTPHLFLWLGLASGAALGAALHPHLGLAALWPPAGLALVMAFTTQRGNGVAEPE